MSSISEAPSVVDSAARRRTSSRAGRSRRDSACPRPARGRRRARGAGRSPGSRWRSASAAAPRGGASAAPGRALPRELLTEPVEQAARVGTEPRLEVVQRRLHRSRPPLRLVRGDQQVSELVEEPQRADVAGLDRRAARRPRRGSSGPRAGGCRRVGDHQVAAGPDQGAIDGVSLAWLAADVEGPEALGARGGAEGRGRRGGAHRRSMARAPVRHGVGRGVRS